MFVEFVVVVSGRTLAFLESITHTGASETIYTAYVYLRQYYKLRTVTCVLIKCVRQLNTVFSFNIRSL